MDRILFWAVQSQGQWRSISIELSQDRHRGWSPYPFAKKWRLQYNHWRKGSQLESTTSQQNWSKQVERMLSPLSRQSATTSGRQENGQPCGPSPSSSHFLRKATCSSARTTEWSASPVTQAKSCWRLYWTDWSHKQRRSLQLQSRKEHHRADLQPTNSVWEISPAPGRLLPCLHKFQEGLRQCMACSFVGNHEEIRHQHQPYPSHQNLYDWYQW